MKKATTPPAPTAIAARAADAILHALATDMDALGNHGDQILSELFSSVVGSTIADEIEPLTKQIDNRKIADEIGDVAYEACVRHRQFGYLLGVEVGKRLAGGVR